MERRKVLDDATRQNITELYKASLNDKIQDRLVPKTRLKSKMREYLKELGFHNSEEIKPVNRIKEAAVNAVEEYLDNELRTLMKTIGTIMVIQDKQTVNEEEVTKAIQLLKARMIKEGEEIVMWDIMKNALLYREE